MTWVERSRGRGRGARCGVSRIAVVLAWSLTLLASAAQAQPDAPAYALVVGSNTGGPGQGPLQYAHDDALRVAEVLTTLGHYAPERIERLLDPTPAQLRSAIAKVSEQLAEHAQAGERSQFFFYYSGHARADALSLGDQQLKLDELRQQ